MTDLLQGSMTEDEFLEHMSTLSSDKLEHYGIKGMRWGRRKSDSNSASRTSADAARVNKIKKRVKSKGMDNLSNDDIAKLNKRSQLLNEYKKNNPSKLERGMKAAATAVALIGTTKVLIKTGQQIAQSPLARKGAQMVADALRNMASNPTAVVNTVKAITG